MAQLILVWVMLALGHSSARIKAFPESSADALNAFVIYVSLPALILGVVPRLSFRAELLVLVLVPWCVLVLSASSVLLAARSLALSRGTVAALLLAAPLGNTSFLGFPLVSALLGSGAVAMAALYDQLGSFLILATYGLAVAARYAAAGESTPGAMLRRLLLFPPFLALLVALLPLPRPPGVDAALDSVGQTLVPIAMFAVGFRMKLRLPRERAALALGLGIKMLLGPAAAWILCRAVGASPGVLRVAVLEAAMPPMISAGALAALHGFAPELSAALVGYGIAASMITVPVIAWFLS